jgi:hypothetical protein
MDWNFEVGYLGSKNTRLGIPDANINQFLRSTFPWERLSEHQSPEPLLWTDSRLVVYRRDDDRPTAVAASVSAIHDCGAFS